MFEIKQNDLIETISAKTTRFVIEEIILHCQNMRTMIQILFKIFSLINQIYKNTFINYW